MGTGAGWSQNDLRVHFGLGAVKRVARVLIEWPSGQTQVLTDVAAKQILTVIEPGVQPRLGYSADRLLSVEGEPHTTYVIEGSVQLTGWVTEIEVTTDSAGMASTIITRGAGGGAGFLNALFFRARTQ